MTTAWLERFWLIAPLFQRPSAFGDCPEVAVCVDPSRLVQTTESPCRTETFGSTKPTISAAAVRGSGVAVAMGVEVGVAVLVGEGDGVIVGVAVGVGVAVAVAVGLAVMVAVGTGVAVGAGDDVGVAVAVAVGTELGVGDGADAGERVGSWVGVGTAVAMAVASAGVGDGGVTVAIGSPLVHDHNRAPAAKAGAVARKMLLREFTEAS